jgi:hypothetical protein
MPSSGILRRMALVRTDISEELRALSIFLQHESVASCANVVPSSPIPATLIMKAPFAL